MVRQIRGGRAAGRAELPHQPAGRASACRRVVTAAGCPNVPVPGRLLDIGLTQLVRRGLRGVWVRGELPASAAIWAANHHSWWDGFVAAAVLREQQRPAALLMDGGNLDAFRWVRLAGVISAQRPRQALRALREGRVLVIFPEGELDAALFSGDPRRPVAGFRCAVKGRLSWDERITHWAGRVRR